MTKRNIHSRTVHVEHVAEQKQGVPGTQTVFLIVKLCSGAFYDNNYCNPAHMREYSPTFCHPISLLAEISLFSVSPAHDSCPLLHPLHYFAATCLENCPWKQTKARRSLE